MAGYDVGNQNCTVTVLSKLETTNFLEHDLYYTMPSELPFDDEHNPYCFFNISQIKWLLGRKFTDPELQSYLCTFPLKVECHDKFPLIQGRYTRKNVTFTPNQLLAELISMLKLRAQENLKLDMVDCCIAVPVYFSDLQRRALLDAATHAGLKPRMILHETTATALAYAFHKNDFHENNERNVVFVDMGQTSMQACIAQLKKGNLEVLSHASDTILGGRNFDEVLFKHLRDEYRIEVQNNVRASIKLLWECEGLKTSLSLNPRAEFTVLSPLDGKEVTGFITRRQFEKMSKSLLKRVEDMLMKVLRDACLTVKAIDSVEVVGLGSFMPVIEEILTNFFRKVPSRTLETGKCIAMGCAIQCALLANPSQLKGFQVHDILPYSIALSWKLEKGTVRTRKNFFTKGAPIPSEKYLKLLCDGTFSLDIFYYDTGDSEIPLEIRTYMIGPFHSNSGKEIAASVRVQLNINGVVNIVSASVMEEEREVGVPVWEKGKHEIQEIEAQHLEETKRRKQGEELAKERTTHENLEKFLGKNTVELGKEEKVELEQNQRKKEQFDASMQLNAAKSLVHEVIGRTIDQEDELAKTRNEFKRYSRPNQVCKDKESGESSQHSDEKLEEIQTSPHTEIAEGLQKMRVQQENLQKLCDEIYNERKGEQERLNSVLNEISNERKAEQERANSVLQLLLLLMKSYLEAIHEKSRAEEDRSALVRQLRQTQSELEVLKNERATVVNRVDGLHQLEEGQASCSQPSNKGVMNYCEFTHLELEDATANLAKKNIVGEGVYSIVYKGVLHHTHVAIKKMTSESRNAVREFIQEVEISSRIRHPHLITLIGACEEPRALVFEFMPNGSLEDRLYCKNRTAPIPWYIRIRIALEVCSVLIFLHSIKPHRIAHGDFKPSNILIDSNYRSKVGGFGTARLLIQNDVTLTPYHHTDLLHATLEYMAPEYYSTGILTTRCDVYSFGLVLLQLVTGKKVRQSVNGRNVIGLRELVQEEIRGGYLNKLVDPLAGEWPHDDAKEMIRLGLKCSETSRENRLDLAKDVLGVIKSMEEAASIRGLFAGRN